jgi:methionine-rich copper-binding protein CopC
VPQHNARSSRSSSAQWMRPNRLLGIVLLMGAALFLQVPPAGAHAVLVSSDPSSRSTVAGPNVCIELRFNVRVDGARSRLVLVESGAAVQPLALKIQKQTSPATLTAEATGLKPGAYSVRWQVLASDGHITRGEVPFTVGGS